MQRGSFHADSICVPTFSGRVFRCAGTRNFADFIVIFSFFLFRQSAGAVPTSRQAAETFFNSHLLEIFLFIYFSLQAGTPLLKARHDNAQEQ